MLSFLPSTRHPERSEGSRFKTIVNQLSLNTSRQEGAAAGGSPSLVPAVPPFPPQAVGQQCLTTLSLLPSTVIRGRSADNRKALLNSRCPLRGHRVYEGNNANVVPLLPYAGPTLPDLAILCRIATWGRSLTLRAFLPAFNRHPERSEGSRFKTIVNQLSLNTGRQEATSSPPLVPDGTTFPYRR